jgi:hypothetical protein
MVLVQIAADQRIVQITADWRLLQIAADRSMLQITSDPYHLLEAERYASILGDVLVKAPAGSISWVLCVRAITT